MSRRKTAWDEVAQRGKSQPGKWFLHPTLVASTEEFAEHTRARVKALRPDEHGRFQFHRANKTTDDLGRKVFDLYIRYQRTEEP